MIKSFVPFVKGGEYTRITANQMAAAIASMAYKEIKPAEESKTGFVSYHDPDSTDELVTAVDPQGRLLVLTLRVDQKKIPPATLLKEIKRLAAAKGVKVTAKTPAKDLKPFKADALTNLLPSAPVDTNLVHFYFDSRECLLLIEATAIKAADDLYALLARGLSRLDNPPPLQPVRPDPEDVAEHFTKWLSVKEAPQPFLLGDYVHLASLEEEEGGKPSAKLDHHNLTVEEVEQHLGSGKKVRELALRYDNDLYFVITKEVVFKRVTATKNLQEMIKKNGEGKNPMDALFTVFNKCHMALTEMIEVLR